MTSADEGASPAASNANAELLDAMRSIDAIGENTTTRDKHGDADADAVTDDTKDEGQDIG